MNKLALALVAATALSAAPASAAARIVVEGGGTPVVFQGDNGNRFALLGVLGTSGGVFTQADIPGNITNSTQNQFVGAFSCTGAIGSLSCGNFDSFAIAPGQRLLNNLLVEFSDGGDGVFDNVVFGGSATLGLAVTQNGQPPITAAVPEPSTWAMLLLGFFAIGGAMRARRKSEVSYNFA
jgi:hypothetical protein